MRKAVILLFALALTACATISNPFTQSRVDTMEDAWGAALAIAANYRDACAARVLQPSCRTIVINLQTAAVPVQTVVLRARASAKNPTITTGILVEEAIGAIGNFKNLQTQYGVN